MRWNPVVQATAAVLLAGASAQGYPAGNMADDVARAHGTSAVARMDEQPIQSGQPVREGDAVRAAREQDVRGEVKAPDAAIDTPEVNRNVNNTVDGRPGP